MLQVLFRPVRDLALALSRCCRSAEQAQPLIRSNTTGNVSKQRFYQRGRIGP